MRAPVSDSEPRSFGVSIGTRAAVARAAVRSVVNTAALGAGVVIGDCTVCSAAACCAARRLAACGCMTKTL